MLPVIFAVNGWLILTRPWESPAERAYRVCATCADIGPVEVDHLIDTMRLARGIVRQYNVKGAPWQAGSA